MGTYIYGIAKKNINVGEIKVHNVFCENCFEVLKEKIKSLDNN
jgi:hypothetical protein